MPQTDDDLITVGHILGAHGVRGQVKVYSLTEPRENIVDFSPWIIDQGASRSQLEVTGKRQGKNVLAELHGISTRDQAEALTGAMILIRRHQLPQLEEGEFYWSQITGLQVINLQGLELGRVDHLIETGANDVLVVQGERERLIPYVMDDVVKSIDLEQQKIVVDWQEDY